MTRLQRVAGLSYSLLLRLLPARIERRDGPAMLQLFERVAEDAARAGGLRLVRVWLASSLDLVSHAFRLRLGRENAMALTLRPERKAGMLDSLIMDIRQSVRELYRRPVLALLAGATFALGIGATTAIFSVVHSALLRDLPYVEPDRIVRLMGTRGAVTNLAGTLSYLNYRDVATRSGLFAASSGYDEWRPNLTGDGEPRLIDAAQVNPAFFEVFGLQPAAGRFFVAEEDIDGRDRVVVLSWGLWQSRYAGDPAIVGRDVQLNGVSHTVVGIAPREFEDPLLSGSAWGAPVLWRPFGFEGLPLDQQPSRGSSSYVAVARLAPGVTVDRARAELASLSAALEAEFPTENRDVGMTLLPIRETIVGDVRGSLLIVLGAVGFVLAIAAANVGSLLLGRAAERRTEIAIRAALGATRRRIIRRTVIESLVTAVLGGALGVLVAVVATRGLASLVREFVPRTESFGVNVPVLGFTFLTTIAAGLVCSVLPALLAAGADPRTSLSETPRGATGSARSNRFRRSLVTVEVALAIVLLVGAALLGRTLWNLMRVDVGIDTAGLLAFDLAPPASAYPDAVAVDALYQDLADRLAAVPGVESIALVNIAPLTGGFDCSRVVRPDDPNSLERVCPELRTITPDYFSTAGLTLIEGRPLEPADRSGSRPVAVITAALATALWPGTEAVGRHLIVSDTVVEVVGVATDVKHLQLAESAAPMLFLPYDQGIIPWHGRRMTVMVRTAADPLALAQATRATVAAVDAQLPITNLRTMESVVSQAAAAPRFRAVLLGSFALLAIVLAAIGIYGVVSYSVAQRTREVAIRLALGARNAGVVGMVLKDGLAPVALGIAIGVPAAWALTRVVAGLLYGVRATDPGIFLIVPAALLAVAALAALMPARRAVRTDPMHTLREA